MEGGDRVLVCAGLTAAVVVGALVLWGPGGAPRQRKRRGQIAGLQNLGRTCFLNTLLQALAASPALVCWLRRHSHVHSSAVSRTRPGAGYSLITTLYTVIDVVNGTHETARGTPVCPLGVFNCLKSLGWVIPEEQQDAHELLHVLLSCVEEEAQAMAKKPGCLSDALGLAGGRAYSVLASPASPPSLASPPTGSPARADSTPPMPSPGLTLARPASAAPGDEPDFIDDGPMAPVARSGLQKGVSRSFCHLNAMGRRWGPVSLPARPPPPPPFHGTVATRLQCTVCSHKTPIRYDKFDSISLSMGSANLLLGGTISLAGLLRAFTAPEMVRGVKCAKCAPARDSGDGAASTITDSATYTQHIKTVSFGKLPTCLCLHIARVQWSEAGLCKRSEFVSFPEVLSLAPYTSTQPPKVDLDSLLGGAGLRGGWSALSARADAGNAMEPRALYSLVAAVVHVGGPRSGHFVTYRRGNGFEAKRWFYTSDTMVHEVTLQEVLHCCAYMLFYQRIPSNGHTVPVAPAD